MAQNWRTEVNAADHFLHERKRLDIDQRRPVIRRASDLVGPGIGASAVRITDFNDILATYNGYYSAGVNALAAPNTTEEFTGFTIMDDALGGTQVYTGMVTGNEYKRLFLRNPSDPSSVSFGLWKQTNAPIVIPPAGPLVPASAYSGVNYVTTLNNSTSAKTTLIPPDLTTYGAGPTYEKLSNVVYIRRPGIYSGFIFLTAQFSGNAAAVDIGMPDRTGIKVAPSIGSILVTAGLWFPISFVATIADLYVYVQVRQNTGSTQGMTWANLAINRLGDAA